MVEGEAPAQLFSSSLNLWHRHQKNILVPCVQTPEISLVETQGDSNGSKSELLLQDLLESGSVVGFERQESKMTQ